MKLRTSGRRRTVAAATALAALLATGLSAVPAVGQAAMAASEASGTDTSDSTPSLSASAAQAKAAESGDPVEILSLRDESSTTVANPDGTFTTNKYVQPVRTRVNGKWTDIDTTLVKQKNGTYAPKAALSGMAFSGGGDATFAEIEKDGRSLSLDWPEKLPKPKVDGSTATYEDVLANVDLKVTASPEGFSHVLVVKTAEAADNPELQKLQLPLDTASVKLQETEGGGLEATDSGAGGTVFEAPQPVMWDSSNAAVTEPSASPSPSASEAGANTEAVTPPEGAQVADVGMDVTSDTMTLTPDASLLTDSDTVYPVYIDPVVKTANRSAWTMVSSNYSTSEFWKFDDDEGVGLCPSDVSYRCSSSSDVKRQFFAIPTGSFEGKDIVSAEFAVTQVFTYSSAAREVQLARVNSTGASAISSSTNWSNQPSSKATIDTQSTTETAGSCTSTNQNVRFGVTSTVQTAADKGWDTTTFRLKAGSESDTSYWRRFCGNAHLEVTYNRPPLEPVQDDLQMKPGGSCEYGNATEHYVTKASPRVSAVIRDYDHGDTGSNSETLQAQFKVWWTDSDSDDVVTHYAMTPKKSTVDSSWSDQTGVATFFYTIGSDVSGDGEAGFTVPPDITIAWAVRGYDGQSYGAWSTDGDQTRCEFIYDSERPESAVITSAEYPDDEAWYAGVGDYGNFTMDSPADDVTAYSYYFTGPKADNTQKTATPATTGGAATIRWMPPSEGTYTLHVTAVDGAGYAQETPTVHVFLVSDGRAPVAGWTLGDAKGSTKAAGSNDTPDATAGSGVAFGEGGPLGSTDTAASFDGTESAYLDSGAPAVDTSKTFSVSAWVMLPSLPTESVTVVSQDGTAQPGFELGYDIDSASWTFRTPVSDMDSLGTWKVSGAAAVATSWTHLIGVYDAELGKMMLYVNGTLVAEDVQARHTTWNATGAVQIGRKLSLGGYTNYLTGSVADVKLHDRVIPPTEGQEIGGIQPHQLSYWQLDEATSGLSPETAGGTGLTLGGGASIYVADDSCDPEADPDCVPPAEPLSGDGHLALNGTDAYATRAATGPLSAQDSFTLTARARLASASPTVDETVLSLTGANGSAIRVKYSAADARWQLVVTSADATSPVTTTLLDKADPPSSLGDGDHFALVYNAVFGDVLLYVNGTAVAEASWDNTWDFSTTSLQVGRTLTGTTPSEYFSGAVDEVRMYQGPLDASLVAIVTVLPAGASIDESSA
ncbi:LamG-like jellyroll fold domain-containing protein [Streptomyces fulvoviolaceus]|uniref:LamG-like jellyroll fold domain-containing protein n=1 Tax=Streptomyces fulvoviolaceus TaxID=285535 RepID=UPI0021BF3F32|nr:LamG-like jellyroll fold domain-containing protein [Streptomyces fulvoviolaceus]MCT9075020.1 DNRLRE domain-containing protein [Streptomyces fulvoviolaceus]